MIIDCPLILITIFYCKNTKILCKSAKKIYYFLKKVLKNIIFHHFLDRLIEKYPIFAL